MTVPTAPIRGVDGKCYINGGSHDSPSWALVSNCKDIEPSWEWSDQEATARAGGGFKAHEPTLGDLSFTLTQVYDPADAAYQILIAAFQARTAVDVVVLDQAIASAGAQGPRGTYKIFKASRKEGVDGIMEMMFEFKLCYSTHPPTWYTSS